VVGKNRFLRVFVIFIGKVGYLLKNKEINTLIKIDEFMGQHSKLPG